ncbi:MAG: hypothetical protein Q9173_007203, partial [Seirophora scorigena]
MATDATKQERITQTVTASSGDTAACASGLRIFHVGRSGWTYTHVLDGDNSAYLYTIDINHAKLKDAPEVMIKSAQTSQVAGTITVFALSRTIGITVNGHSTPLEALSAVSAGRVFNSHADSGRKLNWDGSSVITGGEHYLKTEPEIEKELFDQILTSGLAMVEHRAQRNRHGFGGAVCAGVRMTAHPFQGPFQ